MIMIYIQIPEQYNAKGFYNLMLNGPVKCLPDNVYVVNEEQIKILKKSSIPFKEIDPANLKPVEPEIYKSETLTI